MKIFGADLSINGSGIVKLELNQELEIINKNYLSFTDKKYISEKSNGNILNYKKEKFKNYIDKNSWIFENILKFISDCEYGAIENYAFASKGLLFHIGEFTGTLKFFIYQKGIKLRLYEPTVIKKFASSYGGEGKQLIVDSYDKLDKKEVFDLDYLCSGDGNKKRKVDPKYESPRADIIDAWWIVQLLLTELKLRNGIILLKELEPKKIEVFNHVNKKMDANILSMDFLFKEKN